MTPAIRAAQAALAAAEATLADLEARADAAFPTDKDWGARSDWLLRNGRPAAFGAIWVAEDGLLLACRDHIADTSEWCDSQSTTYSRALGDGLRIDYGIRETLLSLCRRLGAEDEGRQ